MAEDKQLTVAELLARNASELSGERTPRRRRARGKQEGGVSVAELTGRIAKVEATPVQSKHSGVDIDEPAPVIPAPRTATKQELADAEEIKKAEFARKAAEAKATKPAEQPAEKAAKPADAASKPADAASKPAQPENTPSAADTTIIKKVEDAAEADAATEADAVAGADTDAVAGENASEDAASVESEAAGENAAAGESAGAKLSALAVVLLAIIGVVLGAVVFEVFELIWKNLGGIGAAVLAVVVTAIMVFGARALRTENDKTSMILAGIVGLLMTFGPMLVI